MKKALLTIMIVLGVVLGASAQDNGGLFGKGPTRGYEDDFYNDRTYGMLSLPTTHGDYNDSPAVPLGGGALLLIGFSAAYAGLRRKKR